MSAVAAVAGAVSSDTTYAIVSLVTAASLLTVGLVTPQIVDNTIDSEVQSLTVITSLTSPGFDAFAKGNNTFNSYYFFNYNNPEEIAVGGTPDVTEIGPYTYQFKDYKFDVLFDLPHKTRCLSCLYIRTTHRDLPIKIRILGSYIAHNYTIYNTPFLFSQVRHLHLQTSNGVPVCISINLWR